MTHYWKHSDLVAVSVYIRKQLFSWVLGGNRPLYPLQHTQLSWESWAMENGQRAQGFRHMHTVPTVSFQCLKMWESVLSPQSRGAKSQLWLLPPPLCLSSPPLSWRFLGFSSLCPPVSSDGSMPPFASSAPLKISASPHPTGFWMLPILALRNV